MPIPGRPQACSLDSGLNTSEGITTMPKIIISLALCLAAVAGILQAPFVSAQVPDPKNAASILSAVKSQDTIVITSTGGPLTYKAVIDPKIGGDITPFRLPPDGDVVARELNDLFFLGEHGDQYTLRGWTGRSQFTLSRSPDPISPKPPPDV